MASAPFARTRNSCSDCDTDIFNATYNPATNQMAKIGTQTPSYDADGDVLNDYLNSYSWDAYGRPVIVNGVDVTYDALGRMVEVNNGGTYTEFQYSPNGFKMQDMNGQTGLRAFVPLPGGAMAVWGPDYYRHSDWIGSGRFASNWTGVQMVYDLAYGPFGEPYAEAGTAVPNFTGMNQDTAPNVYDFPAREYGIQGRWPSPDCRGPQRGGFARWGGGPAGLAAVNPMDPQTWNRYAYVRNSPLSITDPTGMGPHGCQARTGGGRLGGPRPADCGNGCADSDINCIFGGGGGGGGVDGGGGGGGGCEWYDPTCGPPNGCDFWMGDTCNPTTGQNCDNPNACGANGIDPGTGLPAGAECGDSPMCDSDGQVQSITICDQTGCSNVTTITVSAEVPINPDAITVGTMVGNDFPDWMAWKGWQFSPGVCSAINLALGFSGTAAMVDPEPIGKAVGVSGLIISGGAAALGNCL